MPGAPSPTGSTRSTARTRDQGPADPPGRRTGDRDGVTRGRGEHEPRDQRHAPGRPAARSERQVRPRRSSSRGDRRRTRADRCAYGRTTGHPAGSFTLSHRPTRCVCPSVDAQRVSPVSRSARVMPAGPISPVRGRVRHDHVAVGVPCLLERGHVPRALVGRRVGPGRDGEPPAELVERSRTLAAPSSSSSPVSSTSAWLQPVPQQRRRGHHDVGAGEQVGGDVLGDPRRRSSRRASRDVARAASRSRCAAAAPRPARTGSRPGVDGESSRGRRRAAGTG